MKNLIISFVFTLASTTHAVPHESSPRAKAAQQTQDFFKNIKSTTALLKALEGKADPTVVEAIRKRLPKKDLAITFEKVTSQSIIIKSGKESILIEFLGEADGSATRTRFSVNQKEFEFDVSVAPEEQMDELAKLLPKKTASWFELLIPQVQADDFWSGLSSVFVPLATTAMVMYTMYSIASMPRQPAGMYQANYGASPYYYPPSQQYYYAPQTYAPQTPYYLPQGGGYGGGYPSYYGGYSNGPTTYFGGVGAYR